jgi:hypothetical protein
MSVSLKALGHGQLQAPKGKFRAVTCIDSELYQVGEDADSAAAAIQLCTDVHKFPGERFQVFNDTGEACFKPALVATPA